MNTTLSFQNKKFRILQVSDPQDMHYPRHSMLRMLDKAYDELKPDLVVFTGDNVLGNHLLDARLGNRKTAEGWQATRDRMKKSLDYILLPLVRRNIPFAMIFGNHDDMCCMTKEEIIDLYREYNGFTGLCDSYGNGTTGTYNIVIYSGDTPKFNLWMMDTAWHDKAQDKCFTGVTERAVEWYKNTSDALGRLPSIMFQHIPMPETMQCVEECEKADEGAVKNYSEEKYIRLKPECINSGKLYEPTPGYAENNGQYEAVKQQGDVLAVVYGHHHMNLFDIDCGGVRMIQTPAASFRCYGNSNKGVRLFELNEDKPEEFETKHYTFFDLMGKGPLTMLGYFIDADELEKPRRIAGTALAAGAAAALTAGIVRLVKRN